MIKYIRISTSIFLLTLFFLNPSIAQNLNNNCAELSDENIETILNDIEKKIYSVSELTNCQSRNYPLFTKLIKLNPDNFEHANLVIRSDQTFIKNFARTYPSILEYISPKLKSDPIFFEDIANLYDKALEYASYDLVNNRVFMKKMVTLNPKNFKYASARLQGNFNFVLFSVKKDGKVLRYASRKMRSNPTIGKAATNSYALSAIYLSKDIQKENDVKKIINNSNYSFLIGIESFLKNNYGGINIGPSGARGYRIVNQAQFLDKSPDINRKEFFKWRYIWKGQTKGKARITTSKIRKLSWKTDLKEYPKLSKEIEYFLKRRLDNNTAQSLTLTSLWEISSNPNILIFKLYLLRHVNKAYNKVDLNNTSYLVGIAYKEVTEEEIKEEKIAQGNKEEVKEEVQKLENSITDSDLDQKSGILNAVTKIKDAVIKVEEDIKKEDNKTPLSIKDIKTINKQEKENNWILTIVDSSADIDLENNIILRSGHKEYEFWDIYKNKEDTTSNLIFKVRDDNSEYFEIFSKQNNNIYKPIFKGGGYSFDY